MKRTIARICLIFFLCLAQAKGFLYAAAQQTPATHASANPSNNGESAAEEETPSGQVTIDGNAILTVYEPVGTMTPETRAEKIKNRIISLARDTSIPPESIRLQPRDSWTEILAENTLIMAVTDTDAKTAGKKRPQLAAEDAESIRQAVQTYRQEHTWRMLLRAVLKTLLATLVLVPLLWFVRRCRLFVRDRIQRLIARSAAMKQKSAWHVSVAYLGPMMLAVGAFLRWVVILALLEIYLTVTLGFFSSTRELSLTATWTTCRTCWLSLSLCSSQVTPCD
jgi:hypothetical protein